jgi:parvulin-like peptidyl-prolyl isomerase
MMVHNKFKEVGRKGETMVKRMVFILIALLFSIGYLTIALAEEAKKEPEKTETTVKKEKPLKGKEEKTKDAVAATMGTKKITMKELEEKLEQIPPQYRAMYKGEEKKRLLENMIDRYLLSVEAKRLKIDKIPDVSQKIEELSSNILIQELINREITQKIEITDEEAKKYYDANLDEFKIPEKVKVRQILVKVDANATPEETAQQETKAKELLEKVKAGGDFEAFAKENSDDTRTKTKGGDLGFITKERMSAEFDKVAFETKPGEVGDLVKDQEGFHIIKVDEKKEAQQQWFDSVKVRITNKLKREKQREKAQELLNSLKAKTKVTINEELLKPETKPETPPTPEAKPEVTAPAPETKPEAKPEAKPETKAEPEKK